MRKPIQELFLLRCFACLSIMLLHVLNKVYPDPGPVIDGIKLLLTCGTPVFVFISEFILAGSTERNPKQFWLLRLKYIFAPYLVFAVLYAVEQAFRESEPWRSVFVERLLKNLFLADFPGYFIIIIFQFYALHMIVQKWLYKLPALPVMAGAFVVNFAYLAFFNFVPPLSFIPRADYIWDALYWFPFPGWVFYFAVAYYAGRKYETFRVAIQKYTKWLVPLTVLAGAGAVYLHQNEIIKQLSSKRVDVFIFTVLLSLLLFSLAARIRRMPYIIVLISRFSMGIYLLHPLLLRFFYPKLEGLPGMSHHLAGVVILSAALLIVCIPVKFWLNKVEWGAWIIGKVGYGLPPAKPVSAAKPVGKIA